MGVPTREGPNREFWRIHPQAGAISLAFRTPGRAIHRSGCVDFGADPRVWIQDAHDLWISDTTPSGTYRAVPGIFVFVQAIGNSLYFVRLENGSRVLRRFDGVQSHLLQRFPLTVRLAGFTEVPAIGTTFFLAHDGRELWKTDGTAAGTQPLSTQSTPWISGLRALGNNLMFAAKGSNGVELWISDGTATGTRELIDINRGPTSSTPGIWGGLTVGNQLVFAADDGVRGRALWGPDGTAAGTRLLADIGPGHSNPQRFAVAAKGLVFRATAVGNAKDRVCSFNGTSVIPLGPTITGSQLIMSIGNGKVAISSNDDRELFITDGSPQGTVRLDLVPGPTESRPGSMTALASFCCADRHRRRS